MNHGFSFYFWNFTYQNISFKELFSYGPFSRRISINVPFMTL